MVDCLSYRESRSLVNPPRPVTPLPLLTSNDTMKMAHCRTKTVNPGQAAQYRYYIYNPKQPKYYTKWTNVTKGCIPTMENKFWGHNYGTGSCVSWNR